MGGISPLAWVSDDLVQHGAGEVLVPGNRGALCDHLHPRPILAFRLERDAHLTLAGRALDFALLPILPLLDLRFGLPDLELIECVGGRGGRTLDRGGGDRLRPALGQGDTAAPPPPHGGGPAPPQQPPRAPRPPTSDGGTPSSPC